jgi:hypothetical protein
MDRNSAGVFRLSGSQAARSDLLGRAASSGRPAPLSKRRGQFCTCPLGLSIGLARLHGMHLAKLLSTIAWCSNAAVNNLQKKENRLNLNPELYGARYDNAEIHPISASVGSHS